MVACDSEDQPETRPTRDAGRDAARDGGRDATPDAAPDSEQEDAAALDEEDAGEPDVGMGPPPDASVSEGCVAFTMPGGVDCSAPFDGPLPRDLRCTGLYGRPEKRETSCGVVEFAPAFALWSDGATKRRFIHVPDGQKIDVSNPDAFVYPNGTKVWKEFSSADGERRLETRLIEKTADGWLYTSYVWNAAQTEALQMDNTLGVPDLDGTGHVVPTRDQCAECHGGRDDFVLGWDALMLGPTMTPELAALIEGELPALTIPGNEVEQAALGYLHANCGISCHNGNPNAKARDSGLQLRLEQGELDSVQSTDAFRTGMNKVPSPNAKLDGLEPIPKSWRGIRPGQPQFSLLVARQKLRGFEGQMPRIGTKVVDEAGVQKVTDWIESMTTAGGYPPADP
jgi:hypothetical protein